MFKCNECEAEFLEPKITRDVIPYGNSEIPGPAQACCPFCGGPFDEAKICELCGDSYTDSKHNGVCDGCIDIVVNRFSDLLKTNFTPFEIAILNSAYDGRNIG